MRTLYEEKRAAFSDAAHMAARTRIYPDFLGVEPDEIDYEDVRLRTGLRGRILDGEMGVDVVVRPKAPSGLRARTSLYVQERFRGSSFGGYDDITITEFNRASGEPSELHKIAAGFFVYGVYDQEEDAFAKAYVVDVPKMLLALHGGSLAYRRNTNKKGQDFLCIRVRDLEEGDCLLWKLPKDAKKKGPSADPIGSDFEEDEDGRF